MKKIISTLIVTILLVVANIVSNSIYVYATNNEEDVEQSLQSSIAEQLSNIDTAEFENILSNLGDSSSMLFGSSFNEKITSLLNGEFNNNFSSSLSALFNIFFENLLQYLPFFALLVAISIIGNIIGQLRPNTSGKSLAEIVHFVIFGVIIILVTSKIMSVITLTSSVITSLQSQMQISLPILLTLMTAVGGVASATAYQPIVAIVCSIVIEIFIKIVLPLFILGFVFSIAGNISNNVKLEKMSKLFLNLYKWVITFIFTIFMAIVTIRGITAASYDGISIKSAKFAIKSYIPIVGGYLSEGFNIIVASSVLIKNSLGAGGLLLMLATILSPILQIAVLKFGLNIVAGVIEPVADKRMSEFLYSTSKNLTMLIATIASAAFMYLILVGLIMTSANSL